MRIRSFTSALVLASLLLGLTSAPSFGAPIFELDFSNTPTTLPRTDEGMFYTATVKNVAGDDDPAVGSTLTCKANISFGTPTPTVKYQWLRNGKDIEGETSKNYVLAEADKGQAVQCQVTATNQPDAPGYAPLRETLVSLPPVVVTSEPSPAPPSGPSFPTVSGPLIAAPNGTATMVNNSDTLTEVTTAVGTGTLTEGSSSITGVTMTKGLFEFNQGISADGLVEVDPNVFMLIGSFKETAPEVYEIRLHLDQKSSASGVKTIYGGANPFGVGQTISGDGIPTGTKILKSTNQGTGVRTIVMSNTATASQTGIDISGTSEQACKPPEDWTGDGITWSFQWLRSGVPISGANAATYTVTNADAEPPSLLQCQATAKDSVGNEVITISRGAATHPGVPLPNREPGMNDAPTVVASNATEGPVTLDIELPSGEETFAFKTNGAGWECASQLASPGANAKATCSREDVLPPGDSYPPLFIDVQLGKDAPEVGTALATLSGGGGETVTDEATYTFTPGLPFGILTGSFEAGVFDEVGEPDTRAGAHPYRGYTTFGFNVHRDVKKTPRPTGHIKDTIVDVPRGFVGNALAVPQLCDSIEDAYLGLCPPGSAVGGTDIFIVPDTYPGVPQFADVPIYSLEPEFGTPAQFVFVVPVYEGIPYTFVPELRADEGYAISFRTAPIITSPSLYGATVDLCDFGAKIKGSGQTGKFNGCRKATEAGANGTPLITNPTRCTGPPPVARLRINSWENPQDIKTYDFVGPQITECEEVKFEPEATLEPTNRQADSPTGLEVEFEMPTGGLLSPSGISQANLNNAIVTFPKGMTINPAAADGLGACTLAQVQLKTNLPAQCPDSSKVGVIEIDTPLIRETLTGAVYVAQQNSNPFNETLGLYMVFSSARDGVTIKIAGKLETDPQTGQLISTFVENPEAPFSRLSLKFNSGPRAPLINPPKCGTYAIRAEFSPWSAVNPANPTPDEIVIDDSTYKVNRGPGNGGCPRNELEPKLKAGLTNPTAGAKSPFVLSLSREDGTQRFTGVEVANPKGLTAYLKGVSTCPESALANISPDELAGVQEIANPSCPANSLVGTAQAGAGAGPLPFYVNTGKVYLAGPYKGAPISLAIVTPAVAGPYDFGNVLVRTPLYVDPVSAQVRAVSDPIPLSLHGIALNVRDIRVALDRPNFTAAPTNCEPSSVDATVKGEGTTANVSNYFQVGGCENLGFKPKLSFRLFGGTKRGAHPKFRAILKPRPGDANVAAASVALPRSEFLDQAHIRTICTRVQFAAEQCPKGSIYGEATATTPLLDHPVSGPVYLRSSSNELPDMVVALRGPDVQPIEVELAGRIDSVNGGIRSSFDIVPDQPVSSFVLTMQGGKKGLLVNSRDLCKGKAQRATAVFTAQNGKEITLRPEMKNACKSSARKGKKGKKPAKRR